MAISNRETFPKHFDRDIYKIFFDDYQMEPSLHDKIAKVTTLPRGRYYTEAELSGLGALREIKEGNPITYDKPEEGNEKKVEPTKFGLGFQVTEENMKDDLHQNFKKMPSMLAKSAAYKKETEFWDLFNNGFATHTAWDDLYIFYYDATTHRTTLKSNDTQDNRPSTDVALSETPLQAAFEYFDGLYNADGLPISSTNRRVLIVPTELRWTAKSLWKSEGPEQSADRNINTINPENMEEDWRPLVVRHLTSSTAWFLLDLGLQDMRFMKKDPIRMESADDFATGNALFKVTMRFTCACFNPIGGYGTSGA